MRASVTVGLCRWRWAACLPALVCGAVCAAGEPPDPRPTLDIDYARQVKPLLTRHCVACHGAARTRAGLRLDTAAAALKGSKDGPAILAGHAEESPLILA